MSVDREKVKDVIYIYMHTMEYYLATKRMKYVICSNMGVIRSEIRQTEKEKYMTYFIFGI